VTRTFLLVTLAAANLFAQEFEIGSPVRQGDIVRVAITGAGESYREAGVQFADKTVPLFRQEKGELLALAPVPVNLKPGAHPLAVVDNTGAIRHQTEVKVLDARFPRQNIRATSGMKALEPLPGEMEAMRDLQTTVSPERFWTDTLANPVRNCMTSPFGVARYHNGKPTGSYHRGVDLRSRKGRPVRAPAAGVVKIAQMFRLHGGTVGLDHGQGVTSSYIHLSKTAVKEGQKVKQGEIVGYVGSTGFSTAPHLHWGLYVHGVPVNPKQWNPTKGWLTPCAR
jgi:murein DD-endopeptidase MepM/ murein hydrolase activator NlpD